MSTAVAVNEEQLLHMSPSNKSHHSVRMAAVSPPSPHTGPMKDPDEDPGVVSDSETTNEPVTALSNKSIGHNEDHLLGPGERWPTDDEEVTLPRVADKLPLAAFFVLFTEFSERFTYYGLSGVFQNYIQNPYEGGPNPGAIGGGTRMATALGNFFQFFVYLTPILGGIIADQWLGKFWTIVVCSIIYMIGDVVLTLTAIPSSIRAGGALPGLIIAMIVIGFGAGGIKSNVSPMMADQYPRMKSFVRVGKDGHAKLVDRDATVQSMFNWFYWAINIGSLSLIATPYLEHYVDFWAAYLLPTLMFALCIIGFLLGRKRYVQIPPAGSVVVRTLRVVKMAFRARRYARQGGKALTDEDGKPLNWLIYAKPSLLPSILQAKADWDDRFVLELNRAIKACKIFLIYPVYWMTYNNMSNNLTTQAGQMNTGGLPNDVLQNIDPLVLIAFIPIFDKLIFPGFRKCGLELKPVFRVCCGFFFGALAMAWCALTQALIYKAGPNYDDPNVDGGFNNITVAWQIPSYFLIALSEIFASITGLEYAYTKAPTQMKSVVMSLFLLTNAGGAVLNLAMNNLAVDPYFTELYYISAIIAGVFVFVCYFCFRHYDKTEHADNRI